MHACMHAMHAPS